MRCNPPSFGRAFGYAIKPLAIGIGAAAALSFLAFAESETTGLETEALFLMIGTAGFSIGLGTCWAGVRSIVLLRALARCAERRSERPALPAILRWAGTSLFGAIALAGALLIAATVFAFGACLIEGSF